MADRGGRQRDPALQSGPTSPPPYALVPPPDDDDYYLIDNDDNAGATTTPDAEPTGDHIVFCESSRLLLVVPDHTSR